jgi:hypothetical protein
LIRFTSSLNHVHPCGLTFNVNFIFAFWYTYTWIRRLSRLWLTLSRMIGWRRKDHSLVCTTLPFERVKTKPETSQPAKLKDQSLVCTTLPFERVKAKPQVSKSTKLASCWLPGSRLRLTMNACCVLGTALDSLDENQFL